MLEKPRGKRTTKYKGAPEEATSRTVSLVPMNDNQKLYIDALNSHQQIIVLGPSGTGKTYIAASYAANLYILRKIDKIIITRPAVSVGKSLGALPGDIGEKFSPWLSPVLSVLEEQLGKGVVETGIKNGNIQMAPLEYMRGILQGCVRTSRRVSEPRCGSVQDAGYPYWRQLQIGDER